MKALVKVDPEKFVPKFTVELASVEKMGAGHRPAFSVETVEAEPGQAVEFDTELSVLVAKKVTLPTPPCQPPQSDFAATFFGGQVVRW